MGYYFNVLCPLCPLCQPLRTNSCADAIKTIMPLNLFEYKDGNGGRRNFCFGLSLSALAPTATQTRNQEQKQE
jgi:hypothetical protein